MATGPNARGSDNAAKAPVWIAPCEVVLDIGESMIVNNRSLSSLIVEFATVLFFAADQLISPPSEGRVRKVAERFKVQLRAADPFTSVPLDTASLAVGANRPTGETGYT